MALRPIDPDPARRAAQRTRDRLETERSSRPPPKRSGPTERTVRDRIDEAVRLVAEPTDEKRASAATLVCLWAWLHERIYGVDAVSEITGRGWLAAHSAADALVRKEFGGDAEDAVEFVRWAWKREKGREKWRLENGKGGGRLSWQQLFKMRQLLVDYRIDSRRRNGS